MVIDMSNKKLNILLIMIVVLVILISVIVIVVYPKSEDREFILIADNKNSGRLINNKTSITQIDNSVTYVPGEVDGYISPDDYFKDKGSVDIIPDERTYEKAQDVVNIISEEGEVLPFYEIGEVIKNITSEEVIYAEGSASKTENSELFLKLANLKRQRNDGRILLDGSFNIGKYSLIEYSLKGCVIVPFKFDSIESINYLQKILPYYMQHKKNINFVFVNCGGILKGSVNDFLMENNLPDDLPIYSDEYGQLIGNSLLKNLVNGDLGYFILNCDSYVFAAHSQSDNLTDMAYEIDNVQSECILFREYDYKVTNDYYEALSAEDENISSKS